MTTLNKTLFSQETHSRCTENKEHFHQQNFTFSYKDYFYNEIIKKNENLAVVLRGKKETGIRVWRRTEGRYNIRQYIKSIN